MGSFLRICLSALRWRRHPDLNRGSRCCRPTPYHLAIAPQKNGADYEARTRYLHLGKVALYQMS